MPKKVKDRPTPEQAAERANPGWRAVTPAVADVSRATAPDESAPELEQLRQKYLGITSPARVRKASAKTVKPEDLSMVVMEPITPSDTRVGRKVTIMNRRGKKIGEQG